VAKQVGKEATKTLTKTVLKKIPIIGIGAGAWAAADRFSNGDWTGGWMELGSGLVSIVPGWGTAVSIGMDAALAGRDIYSVVKQPDVPSAIESFNQEHEGLGELLEMMNNPSIDLSDTNERINAANAETQEK
jgi:hypothetical protein